jgi:hypothetical protein
LSKRKVNYNIEALMKEIEISMNIILKEDEAD